MAVDGHTPGAPSHIFDPVSSPLMDMNNPFLSPSAIIPQAAIGPSQLSVSKKITKPPSTKKITSNDLKQIYGRDTPPLLEALFREPTNYQVLINNVGITFDHEYMVNALAKFGQVVWTKFEAGRRCDRCCYVAFKSAKSVRNILSNGPKLSIGKHHCRIKEIKKKDHVHSKNIRKKRKNDSEKSLEFDSDGFALPKTPYKKRQKRRKSHHSPSRHSSKIKDLFNYNKNQQICVDKSLRKIWVGGLHNSVSEKDLHEKFSNFGDILSVKIPVKAHDPSNDYAYGFVNFSVDNAAARAINSFIYIGSREVIVRPARKETDAQDRSFTPSSPSKESFGVRIVSNKLRSVNEVFLTQQFGDCGTVLAVKIVRAKRDQPNSEDIGFVHFFDSAARDRALNKVIYIDNEPAKITVAVKNSYIQNLFPVHIDKIPLHVDDSQLQRSFERCGLIYSAKVVSSNPTSNVGHCHGFVNFVTKDGQDTALGLNDPMVEGNPVSVRLAGSKKYQRNKSKETPMKMSIEDLLSSLNDDEYEEGAIIESHTDKQNCSLLEYSLIDPPFLSVESIPIDASVTDLEMMFRDYKIRHFHLICDNNGMSTGRAIIMFHSASIRDKALQEMEGSRFFSAIISLKKTDAPKD